MTGSRFLEKRLYWLEKAMNGSYTKKQKVEMGKEITRLNVLLKEAKEFEEQKGTRAVAVMAIVVFSGIILFIASILVFGGFFK